MKTSPKDASTKPTTVNGIVQTPTPKEPKTDFERGWNQALTAISLLPMDLRTDLNLVELEW